jgi:lipopolysaccharide/colanic/teichoic acid biosynthesis glycosyltransferase
MYIGENCRIGAGVQVGPHAVIEHDCVLDTRSLVSQAVVFAGSYVGEALEVTDAVVDKNCLVDTHFGTAVTIADSFLLGSLSDKWLSQCFSQFVARAMAVILLAWSWPFLVLTALYLRLTRPGPVLFYKQAIHLPAASNALVWKTFPLWSFCPHSRAEGKSATTDLSGMQDFFFRFLPGLVNVARGQLRFVGVEPRTEDEIQHLAPDWRALYLSSKAGIVTEAYVSFGHGQTADERYSAEVFYAVSAGMWHDTKLLLGYVKRLFSSFSPRTSRPQHSELSRVWPVTAPEEGQEVRA